MMAARLNGVTTNLPHTRGDEPTIKTVQQQLAPAICPTRVGMNRRRRTMANNIVIHLPHTRGDEPKFLANIINPHF